MPFERILVAIDGSHASNRAFDKALELAQLTRVVLGHRGHFLRDHLLASTADRVAENAPCPVMIVR